MLSISDTSVTEGNTGTTTVNVTAALSEAATQQVRVDYATADGTAASGTDYAAASSTVPFDAGETSKTISFVVNGDRTPSRTKPSLALASVCPNPSTPTKRPK